MAGKVVGRFGSVTVKNRKKKKAKKAVQGPDVFQSHVDRATKAAEGRARQKRIAKMKAENADMAKIRKRVAKKNADDLTAVNKKIKGLKRAGKAHEAFGMFKKKKKHENLDASVPAHKRKKRG